MALCLYLYIASSLLTVACGDLFTRIESFDDKLITESPLWTISSLSRTLCAYQCLHDPVGCVSFQFSEVNRDCVGFSLTFANSLVSTTSLTGYQLWETNAPAQSPGSCSDDSSCQTAAANSGCHNSSCRCDVGYNIYGGACRNLAECMLFDDVFDSYLGYEVQGYDITQMWDMTLEDCEQFCLDTPDCESADYKFQISFCYPAVATWFEFPGGRITASTDCYHIQRRCKTWQA